MTDIVQKLRSSVNHGCPWLKDAHEAADEIERLRDDRKKLQKQVMRLMDEISHHENRE